MIDVNHFDAMQIGLASPQQIKDWSFGEVKKPETINYRTLKPERDGLFCEKIFGPIKDWECHCGKYKRIRFKGIICDKCGVEVTRSKVRRERMGHIELASPVSHIWYFKGVPSRIGLLVDLSPRTLEKVIYFASYVVTDPGESSLARNTLLSEMEYREAREKFGNTFKAGMGAEAVRTLLTQLNLEEEYNRLREDVQTTTGQKRTKAIKRLEVVEAFRKSGNRPEWMILDVVPVIPPELRPMVQLDGGRFATSDLNDLYRRVINRNNRLKRLLDLGAPEIIVKNEKRMLQEAVDALIDNGRRGRPVTGPNNRPLKSLSDMLKGKQGRFRQNLLGKRVDYSGRSVIVVGPHLKLHQCGLPKEMALELFKPFVMKKLVDYQMVHNIKSAKRMVERVKAEVWDVLEEVIKDHPVLLNRAPTLHRLGIQAFEPVLVEGKAIQIHPLVCTPYNADFDGDQMAVHLPLSAGAQAEARILMLSANNILLPSFGNPAMVPTQDMVLGVYYLTIDKHDAKGKGKRFTSLPSVQPKRGLSDAETVSESTVVEESELSLEERRALALDRVLLFNEVKMAYDNGAIELQAPIQVRFKNAYEDVESVVTTTCGRMLLNEAVQESVTFAVEEARFEWVNKLRSLNFQPKHLLELAKDTQDEIVKRAGESIVKAYKALGLEPMLAQEANEGDELPKQFPQGELEARFSDLFRRSLHEPYINDTINKKGMMRLVQRIHRRFGNSTTAILLDKLKTLGFRYATRSGNTIGVNDIQVPPEKPAILEAADKKVSEADKYFRRGLLTDKEQKRHLKEIWTDATNSVEDAMMRHLDRLNPVYMMATSGARGNPAQVKQIAGMRGLMANPSGEIITVPVRANLREGLTVLEYFISTHGARKGLADTALRTADSGYLTRRLIDVSQDVIIRLHDCVTRDEEGRLRDSKAVHGIRIEAVEDGGDAMVKLGERITGRVAGEDIIHPKTGELLCPQGEEVRDEIGEAVEKAGGILVVANVDVIRGRISAANIPYPTRPTELIVREGERISEETAKEIVNQGVEHVVVKSVCIRSVLTCEARFGICSRCYGRNLASGKMVEIGETVGIIAAQSIGEPGTQLTLRTFHTGGVASEDIITGLPRVEELFEARKPKGGSPIAEIEGIIEISEEKKMRKISVKSHNGQEESYNVPFSSRLQVQAGDHIDAGEQLVDGALNPHDVLRIRGVDEVQKYLVNEVQRVYRSQGVDINDKHVEVIVRQMLRKVRVDEAGDTEMLPGALVDLSVVKSENEKLTKSAHERGEEANVATFKPVLMGVTKASLATDSFLSAASFQETTRVLTEAAIHGRKDPLLGLKENVIIGKLIPAGTGMMRYRKTEVETDYVEPAVSGFGMYEDTEEDTDMQALMEGEDVGMETAPQETEFAPEEAETPEEVS